LAVEPRGDDGDASPCAVRRSLEDVDVVGNVELAGGMLPVLRCPQARQPVLIPFGGRKRELLFELLFLVLAFQLLDLRGVTRPTVAHSSPSKGSYFRSWW